MYEQKLEYYLNVVENIGQLPMQQKRRRINKTKQ